MVGGAPGAAGVVDVHRDQGVARLHPDAVEGEDREAGRKRAALQDKGPEKAKSGSMSELDEVVDLARKVDIQGTFNAAAVRGLGAESLNERTAKAVDQINENVKKIAAEAMHGGLVFA